MKFNTARFPGCGPCARGFGPSSRALISMQPTPLTRPPGAASIRRSDPETEESLLKAESRLLDLRSREHELGPGFASPLLRVENGQIAHSLHERGREVIESLDDWAETELCNHLKPVEKCWQPSDVLPEASAEGEGFYDQVKELRERSAEIPWEHLVCLVGDMITEEALPTYMCMLNRTEGVDDLTGTSPTGWARWTRGWTAEENRHGDAMNKYLWLTGRINMRQVERTIHNLITAGMNPAAENNPYLCFVYTSFQERATKISHSNTAKFAMQHGDAALAKMCNLVSQDEARHEVAYSRIVDKLFEEDPDGAMLAFADMIRNNVVMPAHLMDDDEHRRTEDGKSLLFKDYATVAQRLGVYTAHDYATILEHLCNRWKIQDFTNLSAPAAEAQEYLMGEVPRAYRYADVLDRRSKRPTTTSAKFSWIFNEDIPLR